MSDPVSDAVGSLRKQEVLQQIEAVRRAMAGLPEMSRCEIFAEAVLGNCYAFINEQASALASARQGREHLEMQVKEFEARMETVGDVLTASPPQPPNGD